MKKKSFNWKTFLYILIPLLLVAIIAIRLKKNKDTTQQKVYQYNKEQAINVQTQITKLESIDAVYFYTGTFEPNKETKLSAEVQGKINAMYADAGSIVKKGQALIKLDDALLNQQLNTVNVQIQNITSEVDIQLQANQIQINGLEDDVRRYKILVAADAIQGIQLEKAELQLQTAKNQRSSIMQKSAIKNAQALRASIIAQLNKTTIYAPFNGVVTAKLSEVGAFASPGIPLLQITDISQLRFTVTVPESDLKLFDYKNSYEIIADAAPEIKLQGKTSLIGSKANVGNSFPVQFTVNNVSNLTIKSGMFGKLNLRNDTPEQGIVIPAAVIVGSESQPQVYLVKNGKTILQNITISKKFENKVAVSAGLKEGDVIVTNGFINLFEGANVLIKN
ncbi:MAG: efflux RND transporter periplasmic adaptor subunit [Chitinophagaceae bacterium]|nr:efflux RND transporter periplasmic adaptor subunit [Chitinophagaceae bacterium]MBK9484260.1 efflux RND transporter periplasmic adaptor subunit [Chitinophagaceae bacterium]MBL0198862.1 efflux RND transporter periplasmic adaptor subunit [Chitinophagaceae bacterium]